MQPPPPTCFITVPWLGQGLGSGVCSHRRSSSENRINSGVSDGNFFESLDDDDSLYKEDHSGIFHNAANDYSDSETDQQDDLNGGEQVVVSSDSQGSSSKSLKYLDLEGTCLG
ncbi:unnamed protein product [Cuscuta europaea]|uniref:Uncharacterized protein n=1 Tax=Cuscuta europaea TaxID=41803 RepID=A0A9P1EHK7_CUSEU|nr:unnamed protein product [Cuscuta europaea]